MKTLLAGIAVASSFSLAAQVFNFPAQSANRISFEGTSPGEGVVAFLDWPNWPNYPSTGGSGAGHLVGPSIIKNSPQSHACYYSIGRESGPALGRPQNNTAHGLALFGLPATSAYLAQGSVASLGYQYGPTGADDKKTWNLGQDQQGIDWFGNPNSSVENRIYRANPAEVAAKITYGAQAILTLGYSPIYMTIDYGATTDGGDDQIQAFTDAVTLSKVAGLPVFEDGLANALLADIGQFGGKVQMTFDTFQTATREDALEGGFVYGIFGYQGSLQAVPEPSEYAAVFGFLALAGAWVVRRNRKIEA